MVEMLPELLPTKIAGLKTGSLLLCHKPFVWYQVSSYTAAFIRWALRSKRYHHIAIIRWDAGFPFVIESSYFQRSRQKALSNWIATYRGYVIGIKPQNLPVQALVLELDKPYDNAAAISLIWYRVTGKWNGRTGTGSARKDYCFELVARAMGLQKPWMARIENFLD